MRVRLRLRLRVRVCSINMNNENINHIGKENKEEPVMLLGIRIDKHLTWKTLINIIRSKIYRAIF